MCGGSNVKKILIIMIEGGGGHRASAKAIAGAVAHLYPDELTTTIVDVSKEHPFRPVNQMDDIYRWLTSDGISLWKAMWITDEKTWLPEALSRMFTPFFYNTLDRVFRAAAPDLVVSVHSLMNHVPLRVLRKKPKSDIPFVTVVTDMVTAHPFWFCPDVDYCMVPTEEALKRGLRYGMPRNRLEVVGQPVDLEFADHLGEKDELRQRLSLDPDRPCVLAVGGGDGMGPLYETARAIAAGVPSAQLIVVAGRNAALKEELERASWEIPTRIYGFVDNMPELMHASDLLVTKAGPGTLAEAFIAGLPVVISSFIPGQEEGNVDYVLDHQAGAYASEPAEIAQIIRGWLDSDRAELERVVAKATALARPDATLIIAERLHEILDSGRMNRRSSVQDQRSFAARVSPA
jgi:1,2-diacylglycerol 3-beta-galactosyltransferase